MRVTDRLSQPQRIVVVIALGLALGAAGVYLVSLGSSSGFGWYAYAPLSHSVSLPSTGLAGWLRPDHLARADLLVGTGIPLAPATPTGQSMSYGHPPGGHALPGAPPPAYRAWVTTAVICGVLFNIILGLPTALIGRIYSTKVTELWTRGDGPGAISASRKARAWLITSIALDVIGLVLSIVFVLHAPGSHR